MPQNNESFLSDRALQAFLQSSETLPLQDALILSLTAPQPNNSLFGLSSIYPDAPIKAQPMLWIDTTRRPEIRDLARVHKTEGPGTSVFTWAYINLNRLDCYFVLHVTMKTPVRVSFRVPIFIREWSSLIDAASQTGSLSLLAGPPVNWRELQRTMNPVELEAAIHAQAGGGITLSFDDRMKRELRQHFEKHIKAIVRLLGRG